MGSIMPKALLVLFGFTAIGVCVLQQRQAALQLRYEAAQMHRTIQRTQSQLWRQQLQIAEYTSPQMMQSLAGGIPPAPTLSAADLDAVRE